MTTNNKNDQQPNEPLFRQEVFDAKNKQQIASIVLAPSIPFSLIAFAAILVGLIVMAFLYQGSYTRRMTVTGEVRPASGLIRVVTPQNGVVLEKHVTEGAAVKKGDVLYVVTSDRVGASSRELQSDINAQILEREQSLQLQISRNRQAQDMELGSLRQRKSFLQGEAETINAQIAQQEQNVALASKDFNRYQALAEKDFVARERVMQKEMALTERQSQLQVLQRSLLNNQREQSAAQREMNTIRTRYTNQNAQLKRSIASARQESTEVEARRKAIITAPQSGTATLVQAEVGQNVNASAQLVSLVPDNAVFEARLFAPSSAIGFIKKGSKVLLRYQAYPYQKFGLYDGEVTSVSSATLSGPGAASAPTSGAQNQPMYAITVTPKQQFVNVYNEKRPLHTGLRVEADILQEKRKLYEWMLEPLFSISGKLAQ